jgi:hypothetical protein
VEHQALEGTKEPVNIAAQFLIFQASSALAQQEKVEIKPGYAACHIEASASGAVLRAIVERSISQTSHTFRVPFETDPFRTPTPSYAQRII